MCLSVCQAVLLENSHLLAVSSQRNGVCLCVCMSLSVSVCLYVSLSVCISLSMCLSVYQAVLLENSHLLAVSSQRNGICEVLYAAAWICGEFSE